MSGKRGNQICKSRGFNEPLIEKPITVPGETFVIMVRYIHDSDRTICVHPRYPSETLSIPVIDSMDSEQ